MNELHYTSTIRDFPLMFLEMKKTAVLLCEGNTADDILKLSLDENIYQLEKEKRRRSMPMKMTKRLAALKKPLIQALASSTADDGKLIAFLALMKAERLVFEYMLDVYANKTDFDMITDFDFIQFIDRLASNSETVAKWKSETQKDINSKLKSILCDVGLAKRTKTGLEVRKPIIDNDFYNLLDENDLAYARTFLREDGTS